MTLEIPFTPRMSPISHQATFLSEDARRAFYALFWEQGTGKSKAIIDNAALLSTLGLISGSFVLAPNGVHRNWHVEELPKHWPEDVLPAQSFSWDTTKVSTRAHQGAWFDFMKPSNGVKWLCMSYDGIMTDAGKKASWDFLRAGKRMYILDESQRVKTPAAKRTKTVIKSSVYADYRRIASGTPMDKPFDIYSQMRFLDADFWVRELGIGSFTAFKQHFALWRQETTAGGRSFPVCVGFQNLEELERVISRASSRVLKEDVLDLPSKSYKRVFHELTTQQRRAYNELREEALTFLDSGQLITAEMALVLDLRLSQITSGFLSPGPGLPEVPFTHNPRYDILKEVLEDLTRPCIMWARFVRDVETCRLASLAAGRRPVVYNGSRPGDALDAFHGGKADDIIANTSSGMIEGHTLNEADTAIFYSNSPKLIARQQAEDRNHRIGQTLPVTVIDLLAERTLDAKKLTDLRAKREFSGAVLGDSRDMLRGWLVESEI